MGLYWQWLFGLAVVALVANVSGEPGAVEDARTAPYNSVESVEGMCPRAHWAGLQVLDVEWFHQAVAETTKENMEDVGASVYTGAESVESVTSSVITFATAETSSHTYDCAGDTAAEDWGSEVVMTAFKGGVYGDDEVSDSTISNSHTTNSTPHSTHHSVCDRKAEGCGDVAMPVDEGTTRASYEIDDGVEVDVQRAARGDAAGATGGEALKGVWEEDSVRVEEEMFHVERQRVAWEGERLDRKAVHSGAGAVQAGKDMSVVVWTGSEDRFSYLVTAVQHVVPATGAMTVYKQHDHVTTTSATFDLRHAAEAVEPTSPTTVHTEGSIDTSGERSRSAEGTEVRAHGAVQHMLHAGLHALMPTTQKHDYGVHMNTSAATDALHIRLLDPALSSAAQGAVEVEYKREMDIVDGALDVTTGVELAVRMRVSEAVHTDSVKGLLVVGFLTSSSSAVKHEDKVDDRISHTLSRAMDLSFAAHIQASDTSKAMTLPVVESKESGKAFAMDITAAANLGLRDTEVKEGLVQVWRDSSRAVARTADPVLLVQTSSAYESINVHVPVNAKSAMRGVVKLTTLQGQELSMPGSAFTLEIASDVNPDTRTYSFVAVHPAVYGSAPMEHLATVAWGLLWPNGRPREDMVIHYVSKIQTTADSLATYQPVSSSASVTTPGTDLINSRTLVVVRRVEPWGAVNMVLVRDVHGHGVVVTGYHKAYVESQDAVAVTRTAARLQHLLTGSVDEIMAVFDVGILDMVAVMLLDSSMAPTSSNVVLPAISVRHSAVSALVMARRVGMGLEGQGGTALAPLAQSLVLFNTGGGCSPMAASWSSSTVAAHSTHPAPLPWTTSRHCSDNFYTDNSAAELVAVGAAQPVWERQIGKVIVTPHASVVPSAAVNTWTAFTETVQSSAEVRSLAASEGHIMPVLGVALRRVRNRAHVDKSVGLWAEVEVVSAGITGQPDTDHTPVARTLNRVAVAAQILLTARHTLPAQAQAASTSGPRVHGGDTVAVATVLSACGTEHVADDVVGASSMPAATEAAPVDAHAEAGTALTDADEDEGSNVDVDVFEAMGLFVPALPVASRLDNASLSGMGAGGRGTRARTFEPSTSTAAIVGRDLNLADTRPVLPTPRPINPRSSPLTSTAEEGSGDVRLQENRDQMPSLSVGLPPSLPAAAAAADASAPHERGEHLSHGDEAGSVDGLEYEYSVKRKMQRDGLIRVAGAALRTGDLAKVWVIIKVLWAYVSWLVVLTLAAALCWTSASFRRRMTELEARHRSAIGAYYAALMNKEQAASALEQQFGDVTGQLAALQRNLKLFHLFGTWETICYLHSLIHCLISRLKCLTDSVEDTDVLEERRYLRALDGFVNAYKRLWVFSAPLEAQDTTLAAERARHRKLAHWALDESTPDITKLTEAFERWGLCVDSTLDDLSARPLHPEEMTRTLTYEEERHFRVWGDYWGELKKYNLQSSGLASVLESPPPPRSPPASTTPSTNNLANSPGDNLPRPFQSPPASPASSVNSRSSSPSDTLPRPFSMRV